MKKTFYNSLNNWLSPGNACEKYFCVLRTYEVSPVTFTSKSPFCNNIMLNKDGNFLGCVWDGYKTDHNMKKVFRWGECNYVSILKYSVSSLITEDKNGTCGARGFTIILLIDWT